MEKRGLPLFLLVGDIILMYSALFLALAVRYNDFSIFAGPNTKQLVLNFSVVYPFWVLLLFSLGFYDNLNIKRLSDFLKKLGVFILFASGIGVFYFYFNPRTSIDPKTILLLNVVFFSAFLLGWRYLCAKIIVAKEKIIVVGYNSSLDEMISSQLGRSGYEIAAFFDFGSRKNDLLPLEKSSKNGIITDLGELRKMIDREKINIIVMAARIWDDKNLPSAIFSGLPLRISYISFENFYETISQKVSLGTIDEIWFLENISKPETGFYGIFKRAFDVALSFAGLLLTAAIFPFVALAIELDSRGPVLYSQARSGKEGRIFKLYKFRTMKTDAEKNGPQWSSGKDDPRVTRVGKFLRSTHIDEFPQFFNILKGDLSFVGPRPERPELVAKLEDEIPFYKIRRLIRPGFTGWAQLQYGYTASIKEAEEKFKYDLYYLKNRSFMLDISIVLKTMQLFFS